MLPSNLNTEKITVAFLDNNNKQDLEIYKKYFDIVLTVSHNFQGFKILMGNY